MSTSAGRRTALALALAMIPAGAAAPGGASAAGLAPAPRHAALQIVLPLVVDDAGLASFARAVATPGSPLYGHYEPVAMLARRFGARSSVRTRAVAFLRRAGARNIAVSPTRMFVEATISVGAAERAFSTRLVRFRTARQGRFIAPIGAAGQASESAVRLPAGLRGIADGVIGLDTERVMGGPRRSAPPLRDHRARRAHTADAQPVTGYAGATGTPGGCQGGIGSGGFTPQQYLSAYGYAPLRAAGLSGKGERVALIEVDGFKYSDIVTYARCFGLDIPRLSTFFVGSSRGLSPGGETTLDLEVLDSVAPDLDSIEIYENSGDAADVSRSLVLPLIAPGAKPQVVSASLGLCEPFMVRAFGRRGVGVIERDVELAAATGITVVASSGDEGSSACTDRKGQPIPSPAVNYPASSPFVTAVGGTNLLLTPQNTIAGQVVWNDAAAQTAAAGGGFSDVFSRPGYQSKVAVQNRRIVPDIAMLADLAPGYAVYCTAASDPVCARSAPWHTVGGTSAAAPLFAGGAALVDQDLHRHGREYLGFVNPLLYALGSSSLGASVFSDVTAYTNDLGPYLPGHGGHGLGCCSAAAGFDAASGWGSVNLRAFDLAAIANVPTYGDVSVAIPRGQHPLRQRGLRVKVYCSRACSVYAFAVVTIGTSGELASRSRTVRFARAGTRVVTIGLSAAQRRTIAGGLRRSQRVIAEVFGVGVGTGGETAKVTAGRTTVIRG